MAEAIVSAAAKQVVNLIGWEANFLWGIDSQIKQLQEELSLMQTFLTNADSRQAESNPLQQCLAEIRNIAYDVEDVVEKFNLKVASKRKEGCWNGIKRCACFLREGLVLHKIKLQIDELTNRIKKATGHLKAYGVLQAVKDGEGSSSSNRLRQRELRRSYPHIPEENVVGFDHQIEELISVLMEDQRTVSICGMGGVGKTTLAKKVFNHHQARCHFEHFAWVYISQQFDRDNVWEVIMSQLGILIDAKEITFRRKSPEEQADKLCNFLRENRCLVVLDDIWSTEAWDLLKFGFSREGTKSKILLTTRYKRVALRTEGHLHEVACLDDEKSWELLKKVSFPRQDSPDHARMEELGKEMVKHCSGLPLAIVVLGGILAQYDTYQQWQEVHNNVKSHIRKSKDYNVQDILALSYNDLSPHQKLCFLYLGHFREDQEIPARKLIHMWVAEGFIPQEEEGNENMEEVAEQHLVELAQRYMIQVAQLDANINQINTCRMHDLMRDFCITKAKHENFLHIFDNFNNDPSAPAATSVHRLATHKPIQISRIKNSRIRSLFYVFDEKFPEDLFGEKSLICKSYRYLVAHDFDMKSRNVVAVWAFFAFAVMRLIDQWMEHVYKSFKRLRVLEVEQLPLAGRKSLRNIKNLIHLRYLCLSDVQLLRLPSSLGKLTCLQTLDLRGLDPSVPVKLPDIFWRMEQLRHLYLPEACSPENNLGLGNLKDLQTLVNFPCKNCNLGDLTKLTNLTELSMRAAETFIGLDQPMRCMLRLFNCDSGCGQCLRSSHIALEEDPMPKLGKLPKLKTLTLEEDAFVGKQMEFTSTAFPQLQFLVLNGLSELEQLIVAQEAMPILSRFSTSGCGKLEQLPERLSSLQNY